MNGKHVLTINGRTQSLAEWSKECGCKYSNVLYRIKQGWTPEEALEMVKRAKQPRKKHRPQDRAAGRCIFEMDKKGVQALVGAIIIQAANDYRRALARLKHKPKDEKAKAAASEVEAFFRSEYFGSMTEVDPENMLEMLKQESEEISARPYFSKKSYNYLKLTEDGSGSGVKNCTILYKNIGH